LNVLYLLGKTPTLDDEGLKHLSVATQETGRIAHIVKQTLGFYRESPTPIMVKLPELVDDVVGLYAPKLAEKKIVVERRYEDVGGVAAFPSEIRQVFSNLIINAIEATANGGKIIVHVFVSRDWSGTNRRGVRVVISDTGTGIALQHRRDLFEPFFTTKGEKGTGLGLWVSNGIVQKHGGSIRVRSSVGPGAQGTCFAVFLPSEVVGTERREQEDLTAPKIDMA
jgi:two-component system, NtrC family, sensor kinase